MLPKGLLILLIFSKSQLFGLDLIDIGLGLYYFSPSAVSGFGLFMFF
jgi:hypothetical protein